MGELGLVTILVFSVFYATIARSEGFLSKQGSPFLTSVGEILSDPSLDERILRKVPTVSEVDFSDVVSEPKIAQDRIEKATKKYATLYPVPLPLEKLAPCPILSEWDRQWNEKGGYEGVVMEFDQGDKYVHDFFEQGLPALFDRVHWIDAFTEEIWQIPTSVLAHSKAKEAGRVLLRSNANGTLDFRIYYDPFRWLGSFGFWQERPAQTLRKTRNILLGNKVNESPYPGGFFREQEQIAGFNDRGKITELEAVSLFHTSREKWIRRHDGKIQKLALSATALVQGHALQALKLVFPVAVYRRYFELPFGYSLESEDLTLQELLSLNKTTPLLVSFEMQTVCMKRALFNPQMTEKVYSRNLEEQKEGKRRDLKEIDPAGIDRL